MDAFDFPVPDDSLGGSGGGGKTGGAGFGGLPGAGAARKSLAGSLLVAHPGLLDPNFRRTVLLLSEHEEATGAFGLILNRPMGQTVGELIRRSSVPGLERVPVFFGGPVSADQVSFAAFHANPVTGRMECAHHLGMEEACESLGRPSTVLRAYIGYSGWGRGQLEEELQQQSWVVVRPHRRVLDAGNATGLWRETLVRLGPSFRLEAEAPELLGLN